MSKAACYVSEFDKRFPEKLPGNKREYTFIKVTINLSAIREKAEKPRKK